MLASEWKRLRNRWTGADGLQRALQASRWLAGEGELPDDVDRVGGLVDLRGLAFPAATSVGSYSAGNVSFTSIAGMPEFSGVEWRGIDLSGAVMRSGRFRNVRIENCRFDHAELEDWRLWSSVVSESSFERANFRGSAMAAAHELVEGVTSWTSVSFDGANLTAASFHRGSLTNCTFRGAKLQKTRFEYVDFQTVVFEGILDRVLLEARPAEGRPTDVKPMRDVSFSNVLFRNCQFQGYKCESVSLPGDVLLVPNLPKAVARAAERLHADDELRKQALDYYSRLVRQTTSSQWDYVYFPADLIAIGDEEEAKATWDMFESAM